VSYGLEDKAAIVTGPGGFAPGYCIGLAEAGADVIVADLPESGGQTVDAVRSAGFEALLIETDVTSEQSVRQMATAVEARFGGADILVNNAAIFQGLPFPSPDPIEEMPLELWDKVMAINLTSALIVSRAVIRLMRARGGGVIVNQASPAIWQNSPGRIHYAVSKGALLPMTRSMARELAPDHIRVNVIAPGPIVVGDADSVDQSVLERMADQRAMKRLGTQQDLVGPLLFLVSEMSAWVTGQALVVDGGGFMLG
jgi:NAD(P)-dependent dehydrogenase (short-subunit alcohol dehydrogenase family)